MSHHLLNIVDDFQVLHAGKANRLCSVAMDAALHDPVTHDRTLEGILLMLDDGRGYDSAANFDGHLPGHTFRVEDQWPI